MASILIENQIDWSIYLRSIYKICGKRYLTREFFIELNSRVFLFDSNIDIPAGMHYIDFAKLFYPVPSGMHPKPIQYYRFVYSTIQSLEPYYNQREIPPHLAVYNVYLIDCIKAVTLDYRQRLNKIFPQDILEQFEEVWRLL